MDRGRDRDDGPDDVEAPTEHESIEVEGADAVEPGATRAAADGDDRPAAWLADVRARAPWLLEPGGALYWRATALRGPDVVPHGVAAPDVRFDDAVADRGLGARPGDVAFDQGVVHHVGGGAPNDQIIAGDAGPPASAGGPDGAGGGAQWPAAVLHPPGPASGLTGPSESPERAERAAGTDIAESDPVAESGQDRRSVPTTPLPALESHRPPAADPLWPDGATTGAALPPPHDAWPSLDARRPAIHRRSATWPQPPARPAALTPVWPPRPHPEGMGLPHPGPVAEPTRPLQRPVTPFIPDRPAPSASTTQAPHPTWEEGRSGWHPTAVPVTRIVDDSALPPWPSLLDDEDGDGDGDGDEPDWSALERGFDRMLRLDREQRRR